MSRLVAPVAVCAWLCVVAVADGAAAAPALAAPGAERQLSAPEARSPRLAGALGGVVAQEPEWAGVVVAPQVAWRFQAAAPASAAPAVNDAGAAYLSTVEGYLHALAPDGSFRWSYGLAGVPIGEPALDPSGHVYVTTTARRIYSIRGDGHLHWERHTPSRIASAAVWSAPGQLAYAARDQGLYAVSVWGEPLWNVGLGKSTLLAPTSLASGGLVVATEGAELRLLHGSSLGARLPLPGTPTQPVLSAEGRLWVVTEGEVLALESQPVLQIVWRAPGRRAALSADGQWLLSESEGEWTWRAASSGELRHRVALPDEASAAPALTNAGVALIPLVSGELLLFDPARSASARVRVGPAPLWRPLWDEARQRALVVAGSGALVAIELGAWPAAQEQNGERHPAPLGAARAAPAPPGGA